MERLCGGGPEKNWYDCTIYPEIVMNTQERQISRRAASLAVVGGAFIISLLSLAGCNGSGQSEVTPTDRPSEGEGWAVQEQMAGGQGQ